VSECRARRAGGILERDDPLFDGDERRNGGRELRDRRPAQRQIDAAVALVDTVGMDDGDRRVRARPGVDLP